MRHLTIVHMSDLHILPDPSQRLYGYDPFGRFLDLMDILHGTGIQPDAFVISGDLVDRGCIEGYAQLSELLAEVDAFDVPVLLGLGNHDSRPDFRKVVLGDDEVEAGWRHYYSREIDGLRVIVLDTKGAAGDDGEIDDAQLTWLDETLRPRAIRGRILVMHHPPIPPHDPFASGVDRLWRIIEDRGVLAILCGHLHADLIGEAHGIPIALAPSVAFGYTISPFGTQVSPRGGFNLLHVRDEDVVIESVILDPSVAQPASLDPYSVFSTVHAYTT